MSHINSYFQMFIIAFRFNLHHRKKKRRGKVYSLHVEYSDRGKPNYYLGGRISEEEFESERDSRSTTPGTIGES